jgi:PTH2 family peptidyl-tRNA hydrolase
MQFVYVVNESLRMDKGKIAAQVSHGAVGLMRLDDTEYPSLATWRRDNLASKATVVRADAETFESIKEEVDFNRLPHYLVIDAGRTQVSAGSETVLAIGPVSKKRLVGITDGLKLL